MKLGIVLFLLLIILLLNTAYSKHYTTNKQTQKRVPAWFEGKWKGEEKCKGVSASVALVSIMSESPIELSLSGIYSIQGEVKAAIKGDTISITRQEVKDPNFTNMMVESGSLILSAKNRSLKGNITIINNQVKDECAVIYYKEH